MTTSVFKDLELKLGDEIKSIPQKGEEGWGVGGKFQHKNVGWVGRELLHKNLK